LFIKGVIGSEECKGNLNPARKEICVFSRELEIRSKKLNGFCIQPLRQIISVVSTAITANKFCYRGSRYNTNPCIVTNSFLEHFDNFLQLAMLIDVYILESRNRNR